MWGRGWQGCEEIVTAVGTNPEVPFSQNISQGPGILYSGGARRGVESDANQSVEPPKEKPATPKVTGLTYRPETITCRNAKLDIPYGPVGGEIIRNFSLLSLFVSPKDWLYSAGETAVVKGLGLLALQGVLTKAANMTMLEGVKLSRAASEASYGSEIYAEAAGEASTLTSMSSGAPAVAARAVFWLGFAATTIDFFAFEFCAEEGQ